MATFWLVGIIIVLIAASLSVMSFFSDDCDPGCKSFFTTLLFLLIFGLFFIPKFLRFDEKVEKVKIESIYKIETKDFLAENISLKYRIVFEDKELDKITVKEETFKKYFKNDSLTIYLITYFDGYNAKKFDVLPVYQYHIEAPKND